MRRADAARGAARVQRMPGAGTGLAVAALGAWVRSIAIGTREALALSTLGTRARTTAPGARPALTTFALSAWVRGTATGARPALATSTPSPCAPAARLALTLAAALVCAQATAQPLYPRAPTDLQPSTVVPLGDYAANAAVARLVVELDRNGVAADGQSPVQVTVKLYGSDGQLLKTDAFATIEHTGGRVLLPTARSDEFGPRALDADRAAPGVQIKVTSGEARFTLLAPDQAQDVLLRVTAGSQQAAGTVHFVPELRPLVAAGLIEGIVNFRNKTELAAPRRNDAFEREIDAWSREFNNGKSSIAARAAFFLKGTISGQALLTAAYDSDKETRTRLLRDIRPDQLYPVYGDSSLRTFDARSGSRLYVRVDRDRDYALYGDFITGDGFTQPIGQGAVASLKQRSLGNYNRTATGLKAHSEADGRVVNAFVFRDSLRQVVEEFASQGSGPYGLRNNAVLEGSDKVEVVVRDRFQPSRILSVRPLTRLVDYSFEPFSGRIVLATFLSGFDENLNPVSLRVTYELDQGGEEFWVGGVDAQVALGNSGVEVGGSAVEDRNALSPYRLFSGNATWRIGTTTAIVVEAAQTRSTVNTNPTNQTTSVGLANRTGEVTGRAARIELAHEGDRSDARVFVGRSSPLFNNPAAPLQGGRDEVYARGGYKLRDDLKLYGEGYKSEDRNDGGGDRSQLGAGLRWSTTDRLTLDLGVRQWKETVGTQGNGLLGWPYDNTNGLTGSIATGSGGGAVGFGNQQLDPGTGLPVIAQGGLAQSTTSLPAGTHLDSTTVRLGAGYKVTERFTLGAEVEGDVSGDRRQRASVGGDYAIGERSRLYGRYERQRGWVQLGGVSDTDRNASAFVFGVDTRYWRDTQVFSEYRLRDAISGRDMQLASGVRQSWDVTEGIRANAAVERLKVISGNTAAVTALALGGDYAAHPLWRGNTRIEFRRSDDIASTPGNDRFDTVLWQLTVARKLDRDWTLLARNYALFTDYAARGNVLQDRAQVGVAYRDTDTNRVNAIGKVEYKIEDDASNAAVGTLRSSAWIASAHGDWHPSRPWWLTTRVAAKWQRDRFEGDARDSFRAQLAAARLVYDVTEDWDVGVLTAAQFGQRGARQTAVGAEVGYLLKQNLWLSAGYNRAGFAGDADLNGYEYTRRGGYVRLRFKFDEDLFKRRDPEVNRSLPR